MLFIISHHLAKSGGHSIMVIEIYIFHMTLQDHVIKGPCDFTVYPTLPLLIVRHCGSGCIMILVFHVISQNHVIIWSRDFIGRCH